MFGEFSESPNKDSFNEGSKLKFFLELNHLITEGLSELTLSTEDLFFLLYMCTPEPASSLTCQCLKPSQVWWMLCLSILTVLLEEERKKNHITLFYNVSQADYWVFNMILPFDYRKKLSWWLSKKILCISSMNLTASLKLPAKKTSSLLGKCFKFIDAWYLDIIWSPPGAIFTMQPAPQNPLTSQGIQKIIFLSKSTAPIVTLHYCY